MDFSQIAILLVVAGIFGIIAKLLKQPILVGYIFAGIFLAVSGLLKESQALESFGQIGVTLLLFLLGMEIDIKEIPTYGRTAVTAGFAQIILTFIPGLVIALLMGFNLLSASYIAIAVTFSSTIIIVKLLTEKKDMASLYGKLAIGILLVQDLVAIFILMFLSGVGSGGADIREYLLLAGKGLVLLLLVIILSKKVLPYVYEKLIVNSQELLFTISIAWALGFASLVAHPFGFSLEIGGFLAGLTLSNLSEHLQIASRTRPVRDFFLVLFFLLLGTQASVGTQFLTLLPAATILSLFVLIGNPLIILITLGLMGYRKRTSFMAAVSLAQISEFSLILMTVGSKLGHVNQDQVALIVIVGVITMTISTYFITKSEYLYKRLSKYLSIFERERPKEEALLEHTKYDDHIVLIGCDRTGRSISKYFLFKKWDFIVVDFNPTVYRNLTAKNVPIIFGDVSDPEIIDASNLKGAKLVVSTISNMEDNLTILEYLRRLEKKPKTIFTASTKHEALKLYESGADYVIVPEVVAGEHIRHLLRVYGTKGKRLSKAGKSHFNRLIFT